MTTRLACPACREATAAEVEADYIDSVHATGVRDLTAEDHAAIWDKTLRLLEEDRGIACKDHYIEDTLA